MDNQDTAPIRDPEPPSSLQPEELLSEFRRRTEALDARLDTLQELIGQIRGEIQNDSQNTLSRLSQVAVDMANGRVYQQIDFQAKGEVGALAQSLNQTLQNLQQLDASVKKQSTQVPELAAQLDAITADTEQATQSVMNRLDMLMAATEEAGKALGVATEGLKRNQDTQVQFQSSIDAFLKRASGGENPTLVAQEILDFLFEQQMLSKPAPVDLSKAQELMRTIGDESFEILNMLQFQDITRQKVEKVILLLKQFKEGLNRLLAIFKIEIEPPSPGETVFDHRTVATQDHIFDATLEADKGKESVEDIIAQFKKGQG
jgi:chemotaxis regulatin CheY-phosphate phosphatase CheZ